MTLHDDPVWIRFPIDEPVTLRGGGLALGAQVNELAVQRVGRRLLALEMTFVTLRSSLREVGGVLRADGPGWSDGVALEHRDEVLATVRFDPDLVTSLPSNVAVLRRRLAAGAWCELANWSLLSVRDIT